MTESQKKKCQTIIHANAVAGAGIAAGIAQLPGADNAPLFALEVEMTIALGRVFGEQLSKSSAKGILAGVVGTTIGRFASQLLVGWLPGFGNFINAATAASVIEGLGWRIVKYFDVNDEGNLPTKK